MLLRGRLFLIFGVLSDDISYKHMTSQTKIISRPKTMLRKRSQCFRHETTNVKADLKKSLYIIWWLLVILKLNVSPMLTAFVNIFCWVWSLHDLIMAKPFSPVNTLKAYSDSDLRNNAKINPFYRPGQKNSGKINTSSVTPELLHYSLLTFLMETWSRSNS